MSYIRTNVLFKFASHCDSRALLYFGVRTLRRQVTSATTVLKVHHPSCAIRSTGIHYRHYQQILSRGTHDDHGIELCEDLIVDIKDVCDAVDNNSAYIVDVRNPNEVEESGHISAKKWINIPLSQLEKALLLLEKEFEEQYGCTKPTKQDFVIFHCVLGIRSTVALHAAIDYGFVNAKHFPGGWIGWIKHLEGLKR